MNILTATKHPYCHDCQHAEIPQDGWCHMFRNAPDNQGCGQHTCLTRPAVPVPLKTLAAALAGLSAGLSTDVKLGPDPH